MVQVNMELGATQLYLEQIQDVLESMQTILLGLRH